MNYDFLAQYVDVTGEIRNRSLAGVIKIKVFAGSKIIFDRLLALMLLILLSPIMIIISLAIKLDSKGPAIFKQVRTGKHGKNFTIYKFRTMSYKNNVHDFKVSDKLTKVGKIIRRTSLDELPQLFNILLGQMSFIGPRPWITDYYDNFTERQKHRCDVRPGLTGLAQCMGRNDIDIFKKIDYDLKYINNYSFKQGIKVIFLTIKCIFSKKGFYAGKNTIKKELSALKSNKELLSN